MKKLVLRLEALLGRENHYGRREAILILLGFMWVMYGIGVYISPVLHVDENTAVIQDAIPSPIYSAMWVLFGFASFFSGLLQRSGSRLGYGALVAMPLFKTISCVLLWGASLLPERWGIPQDQRGWVSASIWGGVVLLIFIVAGWKELKEGRNA